jgi:8-oxoguanine deaminase
MRESAALARASGVGMHTHLAENDDDVAYTRERFGCTPVEYAHDAGWTGSGVWHAHCVKLDDRGIRVFAQTQTGVAHCPTSNMRLASGIAPVRRMRDAGVEIGLGVDGSASNDGSHLLAEARQALLLARVCSHASALDARDTLWMATRGGASVLGRDDIGRIAPGMAADIVAFDLDDIAFAGAAHDPLAALVFCAPARAWLSVVDGRVVVRDGVLTTVDTERVAERHNALARKLVRGD